MADKLTKKEKGFVKDYIKTDDGTQAVLNHYDIQGKNPKMMASVISNQNLKKLKIQNAIKSIAEQIPDSLLVEKHNALLKKIDDKGDIDTQAVKAGLEMAYKLKGSYAPEKSMNLDINVDIKDTKGMELANEYEQKLKTNL